MLVIVSLLVNNKFQKMTHGRTNEPADELISRHTVDKKVNRVPLQYSLNNGNQIDPLLMGFLVSIERIKYYLSVYTHQHISDSVI